MLADVADEDWARPAAVRWDELRLEALEARFDALLALGRHSEAVPELERTVDEHPLREGFARRLMVALYRTGRQADALRVYAGRARSSPTSSASTRRPSSPSCRPRILNHDPDLAAPASSWTPPADDGRRRPRSRRADPPASASPVPLPGPGGARRGRPVRRSRASSSTSCAACGR